MTAAWTECKACAVVINKEQSQQQAYHSQQLSEVVILDDTLHVWGSLRVGGMPELIYSSDLAALASLKRESYDPLKTSAHKRDNQSCRDIVASKSVTFLALLTSAVPTFVPEFLALPLCFPMTPQQRQTSR